MPLFAACEFPLLDDAQAIDRVRSAVNDGHPFSLVRLGDGEGIVLSADADIWLQDLSYLHSHWGSERVSLRSIEEVRSDLFSAIHGADLIGVRRDVVGVTVPDGLLDSRGDDLKAFVTSEFHIRVDETANLSGAGARRLALLHRALSRIEWSADQQFCSAWIHWELLASGTLNELIGQVDHVGLVTSRPEIEYLVANRFGVRTTSVLIPDKYLEAPSPGAHVPDRYRTIRSELSFPEGTLVLVGAGIPGKAYCQWLKESGCIAIDVGSVFDAWVGKASRPRVLESRFRVTGGDRVPAELLLGAASGSGGRGLAPRWKASRPTG